MNKEIKELKELITETEGHINTRGDTLKEIVNRENGSEFDAGFVCGLKQAIRIIKKRQINN